MFFVLILSYIKISKIVNISTVIYFRMTLSITTVVESSAELTTGAFQFKIQTLAGTQLFGIGHNC